MKKEADMRLFLISLLLLGCASAEIPPSTPDIAKEDAITQVEFTVIGEHVSTMNYEMACHAPPTVDIGINVLDGTMASRETAVCRRVDATETTLSLYCNDDLLVDVGELTIAFPQGWYVYTERKPNADVYVGNMFWVIFHPVDSRFLCEMIFTVEIQREQ